MYRVGILAIAMTTTLIGSVAVAATVQVTQGQVSVNRGAGFKQVATVAQATTGDTVMAGPGGSGQIVYPDGCTVQVSPGALVTIAAQSPCAAGQSGPTNTQLAVGAVAVGGAVAAVVLLNGKSNSASP